MTRKKVDVSSRLRRMDMHVPLFRQGERSHGSMRSSHIGPVRSEGHMHVNSPAVVASHVPPAPHGPDMQGSSSSSQNTPVNPPGHSHENPSTKSIQVALLRHTLNTHSSISTEQLAPMKPGRHTQLKVKLPSTHSKVPSSSHVSSKQ